MQRARTWNSLVNNERKVGGDTNMMKYLQKLGKALMLPVAALPVAGILMGVGYLLAPAVMGAAGDTTGFAYTAGFLLIKAGGALIDNMAWLFAVGAAVGLADDHDGTAGLAGLVAFLIPINGSPPPRVSRSPRSLATPSSASCPPSSVALATTSSRTPVFPTGWPSSPASVASPS